MKLVSWNVNGIRACYNKGFVEWLNQESPDILGLQEIKALEEQFPDKILQQKKYFFYIYPAQKKGYSGVAVFTKTEPIKVHYGLGIKEFDDEGRCLILEFKDFIFFNCYFPNGQRDHGRVDYKLRFSDAVLQRANEYKKKKKNIIITGDYNTAHTENDLANPKTNKNTTGFLPIEKEWMDKLVANNYTDTFRYFTPNENGHYTWWTYRGDCRERNIGWRIDYFFVNNTFMKNVKDASILSNVMGSDHCPISIRLKK